MKNLIPVLLLFSCWLYLPAHAQTISVNDFNAPVNFTTGKYPLAVRIVDIDGDGHPDLVVANQGAGTVSVFRNNGLSGTITPASFAAKSDYSVGSNIGPESLALSDLDHDGLKDIVVSNFSDSTIAILRNTSTSGHISFATKISLRVGFYAHAIDLGDLNADNYPEIAVANYDAGVVTIFKNTSVSGSISFAKGFDLIPGGNLSAVRIADIDGDGKPDIATVLNDRQLVSVYRNKYSSGTLDTGAFEHRKDFNTGTTPFNLAFSDLDGDGHIDMVVTNVDQENIVTVFRNTGSSGTISFAAKADFPTGAHPYSLNITDIDGDGKPDILTGDWLDIGNVSLLQNISTSGTISFSTKLDLSTGTNPQSVDAADLNGDSLPDIAVTNSYDGTVSVMQYNPVSLSQKPNPESTASKTIGSFVSSDLMDMEWKQQPPGGYHIASDDGTTINAAHDAVGTAGRFAYFYAAGNRVPLIPIQGNLTFTAKGSGTIEVQIIAAYDTSIQARQTFTLSGSYQDYNWSITSLYPQLEYFVGVIVNGGNASSQASVQFKKNFSLNLRQEGLAGPYMRFRADSSTLIGNSERAWYGWSDRENTAKKKYLQHSAYARMRFSSTATRMVIEYVRDFYDKPLLNLFPLTQVIDAADWDASGNVISGNNALNLVTQVRGGTTYTISGLLTTYPQYVWYNNGVPLGGPQFMTNLGTTGNPLYQLTAPANATNLGLLVQRVTDPTNPLSPLNDLYFVYVNCMVQEGSIGGTTPSGLPIPSPFSAFSGYRPSYISGPAVFVNGTLYKYYQVEGTDQAKIVQFVADDLPAGSKTIEVMSTGQGTYLPADPHVRRAGTYLRAVYLNDTTATVSADTTKAAGSICYIHDSILSGYNISNDAQNNVWMMKTKRDTSYGFTGDIFSEGYAGRILHTDTQADSLLRAFAHKLASFGVNKYWFQIGVNDYGFMTPLTSFYSEYDRLLDSLHTLRPSAKFYVQCIGPTISEGPNGEGYSDNGLVGTGPTANDFRDVQRALATSRSYCEYVDFEDLFHIHRDHMGFGVDTLADGIHPTDIGNKLYADGIRDKSTLLGTVLPDSSLAFYRTTLRTFIKTIPGIATVTAKWGQPPYSFSKTSGSLPGGLTLNADGTITGTPTADGNFTFTVQVTDAVSHTASKSLTLTVKPTPSIVVAPIHIRDAKKDSAYNVTFRGYLGYGPYTLVKTGTTPPGTSFNAATGLLSGTPNTTGTYNFTITATDHLGFTGHSDYNLTVGTGSPAFLTDSVYPTIAIRNDSLFLTAHLHDIYTDYLFTFMGAYKYVGLTITPIGSGALVNVENGAMDGQPVFLGMVGGSYDMIQVVIGVVNPTQLDGTTNILYAPNTYFYP